MLTDSGMCMRFTLMPAGCDAGYYREIRELGCDLQMLDGEIPETGGNSDA